MIRGHHPARLLLLSMYPTDRGLWGPTVRIAHVRRELSELVSLDVVSGYRGERRRGLAGYAFSGRLRGLRAIYVESSSFVPAELDIAFLALARALGIPVLTYVRDAYQLFPEFANGGGLRAAIGRLAFRPALQALKVVSTQLAFPTGGLARAVGLDPEDVVLLPPGAPAPVTVGRRPDAMQVLFVGDASRSAHGADRLIAAIALVRERGLAAELTVVCRPGQEPADRDRPWVRIERAEGAAIHRLLPSVRCTVIPRPRSAYNDLALPIKLFDYLSYGRPVVATDCVEQGRLLREAEAGVVCGDSVEELAEGLSRVFDASDEQLDLWSDHAHQAARRHGWPARARQIVAWVERHASTDSSAAGAR